MIVTTRDTNKTYSISLRVWTGSAYTPDMADELFAADVAAGLIDESCLDNVREDVTNFNRGREIEWYRHSLYATHMHLEIKEVQG